MIPDPNHGASYNAALAESHWDYAAGCAILGLEPKVPYLPPQGGRAGLWSQHPPAPANQKPDTQVSWLSASSGNAPRHQRNQPSCSPWSWSMIGSSLAGIGTTLGLQLAPIWVLLWSWDLAENQLSVTWLDHTRADWRPLWSPNHATHSFSGGMEIRHKIVHILWNPFVAYFPFWSSINCLNVWLGYYLRSN